MEPTGATPTAAFPAPSCPTVAARPTTEASSVQPRVGTTTGASARPTTVAATPASAPPPATRVEVAATVVATPPRQPSCVPSGRRRLTPYVVDGGGVARTGG